MDTGWIERVRSLAGSAAAVRSLSLFDLEYRLSGRRWWFRVTLDREDGLVTLADCEAVSRHLSVLLDVEDVVPHAYELEISSPGVERPLRSPADFRRFKGRTAKVVLGVGPLAGQALEGEILGAEGEEVSLQAQGEILQIPMSWIKRAHLSVDFANELKEKKHHVQ
jgi:ribosome maturation factor RimP